MLDLLIVLFRSMIVLKLGNFFFIIVVSRACLIHRIRIILCTKARIDRNKLEPEMPLSANIGHLL